MAATGFIKGAVSRLVGKFRVFLSENNATILVAFVIMLPVLIGVVGLATDISRAYLVRQRLGGAIDAAALAASATETDTAAIQQRVEQYFAANYPDFKIGTTYGLTTTVDTTNNTVTVSAYANYNTTFMRFMGINNLTVYRTTTVQKSILGLEVVLVLDNTGSMSTNNNIAALITASTNLVNTLFSKVPDPSYLKIGLVPFANGVRVGSYGIGKNPDGTTYKKPDGTAVTPFVTLPAGISSTTNHSSSTGWYGCVIEHNSHDPQDGDTTMVAGSAGQLWTSSEHPYAAHGWDPSSTTNDPYPEDTANDYAGPWDIYYYGSISKNCTQYNCQTYHCSQQACKTYNCQTAKCQEYQCSQQSCQTYHCKTNKTGKTDGDTNPADCKTFYTSIPPLSNCKTFYTDGATNNAHCATLGATCNISYSDGNTNNADCQTLSSTCNTLYTDGDSNSAHCAAYYNSIPPNSNCKTFYTSGASNCQTFAYSFTKASQPNTNCPYAQIQPLTSDQTLLLNDINTQQAYGNTLSNVGMDWGYKLIAPGPVFSEGSQWNDRNWRKAIVLMTDGMNTHDNTYSHYWVNSQNQLAVNDYNNRLLDTCTALKANGVTIYTVTFYSVVDNNTKDFFRQCASSPSQYFDAPTQADLINVYNTIALQLANLHITK